MDGATEFTNQGGKAPSYDHNKTLLDLHQDGEVPHRGPLSLSGGEILEEFARDDVPRCSNQNGDSMPKTTDSVQSMDVSTAASEQQCNVTELPGILDLSSSAFPNFESDLFGSPDRDLFLSNDGGERSRSYPPSPTAPRSSSKTDELTGVLSLEGGTGGWRKGHTMQQLPSNWLTAGLEISAKEFQTIRLQDPSPRDEDNEETDKESTVNDSSTELTDTIMILSNDETQEGRNNDGPSPKHGNQEVETSVSSLTMSPLLSDTTSVLGDDTSPLETGDSESTESFPFAVDLKQLADSQSQSPTVDESSSGHNVLLNVATISPVDVGETHLEDGKLVYVITTKDQSNGMLQKIQVTVDPKAIQSIPVETISGGSNDVQWLVETLESGGGSNTEEVESNPQTYVFPNLVTPETEPLPSSPAKRNREARKNKKEKNSAKGDTGAALNMWLKKNQPLTVTVCPHPGCGMEFTSKTKFEAHSTTHAEGRPYKCPFDDCEWSFPSRTKLHRHLLSHDGIKPYTCLEKGCGKQFGNPYNLKTHKKCHHQSVVFHCVVEGCKESFQSKKKLEIHLREHFAETRLKCPYPGCEETFMTPNARGSHLRKHGQETKEFCCEYAGCNKVFDKLSRLRYHTRSHTGERPYKCTFEDCKWAFTSLQKLKRHECRHTGRKDFCCPVENCGKSFTRKEHLQNHEVFHRGELPFECKEPGCNARFSQRSSLSMHKKRHSTGSSHRGKVFLFSCPLDDCNNSFSSKVGLKNHMIKGHMDHLPMTDPSSVDLLNSRTLSQCMVGLSGLSPAASLSTSSSAMASLQHAASSVMSNRSDTVSVAVSPTSSILRSLKDTDAVSETVRSTIQIQLQDAVTQLSPENSLEGAQGSIQVHLQDAVNQLAPETSLGEAQGSIQIQLQDAVQQLSPDASIAGAQGAIQIQLQDAVRQLAPETPLEGAQGSIQVHLQDAVQQLGPESSLSGGAQGAIQIQLQDAVQQLAPETSLVGDQGAISLLSSISLPGPGSRVFHTTTSGSSRTDLATLGKKSPMFPIHAGDSLGQGKDPELDVIDSMDISPPSISSVTSSVVPTSFSLTSSPLTLRDPTTGAHFIQSQLLQDDPPDDTDISFPLVTSASSSNQSSMHGVLPVSSILGEADNCPVSTATDFLGSDGSFEESTINLQDLA